MSASNRSGTPATGLAQQQNGAGEGQAENQPAKNNQGDTASNETPAPLVPDTPTIETIGADPNAYRAEQRADADLQAQQDMALYALLMFVASLLTVIITAVGVWFVKRTLDATLKAVEDTSEATDAMREANVIARQSSEQQLRAWLGWDERIFTFILNERDELQGMHLNGHFKNTGQTPALECQIAAAWSLAGDRQIDVEAVRSQPDQSVVVAPGMFMASSPVVATTEQIIQSAKTPITIRWKLNYRTIFGQQAETDLLAEIKYIGNFDPRREPDRIGPQCFHMRFVGRGIMT